jgi:hypothetical protein
MHFFHLIVIQMKILLVLSDLIVPFAYFVFHVDMKYLQKQNFIKWNEIVKSWFQTTVIYFCDIRCFKLLCT